MTPATSLNNLVVALYVALSVAVLTARTAVAWRRGLINSGFTLQIATSVGSIVAALLYGSVWAMGWVDHTVGIAWIHVPIRDVSLLAGGACGQIVTTVWARSNPLRLILPICITATGLITTSIWMFTRYHQQGLPFTISMASHHTLIGLYYLAFYTFLSYGGIALILLGMRSVRQFGSRAASVALGLRALMTAAAIFLVFTGLHLVALALICAGITTNVTRLLQVSDGMYIAVSLGYIVSTSYSTLAGAWTCRKTLQ